MVVIVTLPSETATDRSMGGPWLLVQSTVPGGHIAAVCRESRATRDSRAARSPSARIAPSAFASVFNAHNQRGQELWSHPCKQTCTMLTNHFRNVASPPSSTWLRPVFGPLWTKNNARRGGYLCRWSSKWLNRRCTRLTGCIRLRNDRYCVRWGIGKLNSLTSSSVPFPANENAFNAHNQVTTLWHYINQFIIITILFF